MQDTDDENGDEIDIDVDLSGVYNKLTNLEKNLSQLANELKKGEILPNAYTYIFLFYLTNWLTASFHIRMYCIWGTHVSLADISFIPNIIIS